LFVLLESIVLYRLILLTDRYGKG